MVFSIAGAGYAYPDTIISNQLLAELSPELDAETIFARYGIVERRTSLSLDYLRKTKNSDPFGSMAFATKSPTDLGVEAAKMALDRAGITVDQIGLIVAECATPYETTPAESQRIGSRLGVKIPAYDIVSGSGVLPLHLDVLNKWKKERVPEYVLCVTTHALTQRVDYGKGLERIFFGDGASAAVVSSKVAGRMQVDRILFRRDAYPPTEVVIDTLGHIRINPTLDSAATRDRTAKLLSEALKSAGSTAKVIGAQFDGVSFDSLAKENNVPESDVWSSVAKRGFVLGVSPLAALAERWDQIRQGEVFIVLSAPGAQSEGFVVLRS